MRASRIPALLRMVPALWVLWLASPTSAAAQNFSGTFSVQDTAGQRLVVILNQDPQGRVTGTMRGGAVSLVLEGQVTAGVLKGTLGGSQASGFVEARLQNDTLRLTLIDADANHRPDPSKTGQVRLTRVVQPADTARR